MQTDTNPTPATGTPRRIGRTSPALAIAHALAALDDGEDSTLIGYWCEAANLAVSDAAETVEHLARRALAILDRDELTMQDIDAARHVIRLLAGIRDTLTATNTDTDN